MIRADGASRPGEAGPGAEGSDELGRYLRGIARRWRLVALVALLTGGVAVGVSLLMPTRYEATAKLLFGQDEAQSLAEGSTSDDDPERQVQTNVELITEVGIARRVRERLELSEPVDDILDRVDTDSESTSDVVGVAARAPTPRAAAELANAFATEYAQSRQEAARSNIQDAVRLARARLRALSEVERASPEGRELEARIRELEIAAALQTGGVEIAQPAVPPEDRASPRPVLTGSLAAFGGLLLGIALALLLEALDRRIKREDEVEELLGLPVLAAVSRPRRHRRRRRQRRLMGREQEEGYATLATNLRFYRLGSEIRTVMITSAAPGEGKTSVTLGLARALTGHGLRVVAIEADLRRPAFEGRVTLPRPSGLSSLLAGTSSLEDELVELDAVTMESADAAGEPPRTPLWLLPAGPVPPNPQSLLSTAAMREVIGRALGFADVVLIDTAPIATVNDAVTLVEHVNGSLLVVQAGKTLREESRQAARMLSAFEANPLGVVVTGVAPRDDRYGYYAPGALPGPERGSRASSRA